MISSNFLGEMSDEEEPLDIFQIFTVKLHLSAEAEEGTHSFSRTNSANVRERENSSLNVAGSYERKML